MDLETIVNVTNRSNGSVVYRIPEMNVRREFNRQETKRVPYKELEAVAAQAGGRELLYSCLLIENADALHEALNIQEEPEYWLTEGKIPEWINSCSLDEFKDALEFAPTGVKDLIKRYSVTVPLNASDKREAIKDILKFDVSKAIENNAYDKEEETAPQEQKGSKRRSQPNYQISTPKIIKK